MNMALKIIAVDTSLAVSYSCTAFGYEMEISQLHDEISTAMFGKKGCMLHWAKTSKKIKKKAQKKVFDAIEKSKVQFYVFEHKRPAGEEKKSYYLTYIPNNISAFINTKLLGRYGTVVVESDRDFEVKGIQDTTLKFVHNFLSQMCFKLVGKPVTIRRQEDELRATVKFPNQNRLEFIGRVNESANSKAIQLADIVLGYKLNTGKGLEKVFYRKI